MKNRHWACPLNGQLTRCKSCFKVGPHRVEVLTEAPKPICPDHGDMVLVR